MEHCHTWKCLYKIILNKQKMHGTGPELHTNYSDVKILTKNGPWNKAQSIVFTLFLSKVD